MRTIYPRQDLYSVQALVFRDARQAGPQLSLLILTLRLGPQPLLVTL